MPAEFRLLAQVDSLTCTASFHVEFAAHADGSDLDCAEARLLSGDGSTHLLGMLCAPTAVTWRDGRTLSLGSHTYAEAVPKTAQLRWGDRQASCTVFGDEQTAPVPPLPQLVRCVVEPAPAADGEVALVLAVQDLAPDQMLRIDGGAGQIAWIFGRNGAEQSGSWSFHRDKPGQGQIAVDCLDKAGFWIATLAERSLPAEPEAAEPLVEAPSAPRPHADLAAPAAAGAEPWLPFRYARPQWAWVRTYTAAGGSTVSRTAAPGTYFAIRQETAVDGQIWYQTGAYDWVPAASVSLLTPSTLRGVELSEGGPGPEPEPGERQGVVTANVLNVRARPGVSADNPPIDRLYRNQVVTIYAEQEVAGATWYRIGQDRWVHGGWIQLLPAPAKPLAAAAADLAALPVGWVVASTLNVRSRPGTDGPLVGQVAHNERVAVLEERTLSGTRWLRIGSDRWVDGSWVGVARRKARPSSIRSSERWVGISLKEQTAVAHLGDQPVYAALVATGLAGTPTVRGIFRTWWRIPSRKMSGGTPGTAGYYFLEEVTWTCYFYSGYALHTAYWHDAFGRPRSHGCVNMSPYDAWWIFQWSAAGGANSPAVYVYWE